MCTKAALLLLLSIRYKAKSASRAHTCAQPATSPAKNRSGRCIAAHSERLNRSMNSPTFETIHVSPQRTEISLQVVTPWKPAERGRQTRSLNIPLKRGAAILSFLYPPPEKVFGPTITIVMLHYSIAQARSTLCEGRRSKAGGQTKQLAELIRSYIYLIWVICWTQVSWVSIVTFGMAPRRQASVKQADARYCGQHLFVH